MRLNEGKKYKFFVTNPDTNRTFIYLGKFLSDDDNFITIDDRKLGKTSINKKNIFTCSEVTNGNQR
jgi:hypothetical protein